VLTPGAETDVDLVLEEVARIKKQYAGQVFEIGQFYREDNIQAHFNNTGPEIWEADRRQAGCLYNVSGYRRYGYRNG